MEKSKNPSNPGLILFVLKHCTFSNMGSYVQGMMLLFFAFLL
jgi:hypothetical protein